MPEDDFVTLKIIQTMLHNLTYEMQKCQLLRLFKFIQTHSITFQDGGGGLPPRLVYLLRGLLLK